VKPRQKLVVAMGPQLSKLLVGIPAAAYNRMRQGHTHTLDLRHRFGIDLQILLFTGRDRETIADRLDAEGVTILPPEFDPGDEPPGA
jgi:hypothetical protein